MSAVLAVAMCLWIAIGSYTLPRIKTVPPGPTWGCGANVTVESLTTQAYLNYSADTASLDIFQTNATSDIYSR